MTTPTADRPADERALGALRRAHVLLAQRIPGGEARTDDSGVQTITTPVPMAMMSGLVLPGPPVSSARLRALAGRFVARGLPWSISVSGAERADVAELAAELHMTRTVIPTLVLPIGPGSATAAAEGGETVLRVTTDADSRRWAATCEAAFGMPPGAAAAMTAPQVRSTPGVTTYLVLHDERPVATAITVLDARGWLGVYAVGTVPAARRLGVAERLMRTLLEDGAAAGARAAYLQASDMGRPLYDRMGFQEEPEPVVYFLTNGHLPQLDGPDEGGSIEGDAGTAEAA